MAEDPVSSNATISPPFYVTGGTIPVNGSSYVLRDADSQLKEGLLQGEFCYVLNTRQMGKSSLMVHVAQTLREAGSLVCVLDLSAIGCNLTIEQWYFGMLRRIGLTLRLTAELSAYWRENSGQGPLQRWLDALEQVVLPHLASLPLSEKSDTEQPDTKNDLYSSTETHSGRGTAKSFVQNRLVIFIDEINAVRSLPFSTDEFFAGIRSCYNRRTEDPDYYRLTFCLLGVAAPADLIRDVRTSPFNIGRRIELRDFTFEEALHLATGFDLLSNPQSQISRPSPRARQLLNRVLYWTDGHPYMTQRLCRAVAGEIEKRAGNGVGGDLQSRRERNASIRDIDRICREIFSARDDQDSDDNLAFVRNRLLRGEQDTADLLDLYRQIRAGWRVRDDEADALCAALRLTGAIKTVGGYFRVRNRILSSDIRLRMGGRTHARRRTPTATCRLPARPATRREWGFHRGGDYQYTRRACFS